ncbi:MULTISPECIES: hypothetical protein [Acidobacteriaceae]|uniref:hypothetical protein n=1 Tax=Acidobacteriaceae TaxID=204434 RepID=UPI00131E186F|nr:MULTISPECIES: hypothetical protein [Acidobacteriaceae]MDW5266946.1 hypothetical protein [Edaphobacter sp.]
MKKILILALFAVLLCAIACDSVQAQTNDISQRTSPGYIGWDATASKMPATTVTGTVLAVETTGSATCRSGFCAVMAMPQGSVEVLFGPYQSQALQQVVLPGRSIQVEGRFQNLKGQNVLFAKQLIMDGQPITIRNAHGFLVHSRTTVRAYTQTLQDGGKR